MKKSKIFQVYEKGNRLYTENLVPGAQVYQEKLHSERGKEYREWDAKRSKLAALIKKGCSNIFIREGQTILYLGAASGTTASHVSDMVGREGFIFAVEFGARVIRDLIHVAEQRKNIAPILADASQPQSYRERMSSVDLVIQDIAQSNQSEIFVKNCRMFLEKKGYGILVVKARSIDIAGKPKKIFKDVRGFLEKRMTIIDYRELEPFEKDHAVFICKN